MDKILTMIIPTYNGGEKLKWSLGQLLPLVKNVEDRVSVLVNDNCSTDDTEKTVRDFMSLYPDLIVYHKQKENIGSDRNYFDGAARAKTKYICIIGDDDIVTPVYFDVILGLLKKHPELGYINYNMVDITYQGKGLGLRDKHMNSFFYQTGMAFVKEHLEAPSLLTSNVFLREPFLEVYHNTPQLDYPGYNWFYCMLKSIMHVPCYYVGFPIAMDGKPEGGPGWNNSYPLYFLYGMGRIFKELSKNDPELYESWKERQFSQGNPNMENLLNIVARNRVLYKKEYFDKIYPNIETDYYRKRFRWAVTCSPRMFFLKRSPYAFLTSCLYKALSPIRWVIKK